MERTVETETKRIEFEVETDTGKEVEIKFPRSNPKRIYSAPMSTRLYAQPLSGFVAIVALLFVPLVTLPGMVILVLIAEIYLLDWTYSKVNVVRDARSLSTMRNPEDEIDRKVARTGPKDQFIK